MTNFISFLLGVSLMMLLVLVKEEYMDESPPEMTPSQLKCSQSDEDYVTYTPSHATLCTDGVEIVYIRLDNQLTFK